MRDLNLKILDIKAVRSITRLLGKLGISYCRQRQPQPPPPWTYSDKYPEFTYGWGLAETKNYVEAKYPYAYVRNSPLDQFQKDNQIHEIKRTRQFINMLHKLGIKSAGSQGGLHPAKEFVARMRTR